jgi:hypothetical protein
MKDESPMSYFERQIRDLLGERHKDLEETWDKLANREPSNEEILRMLSMLTASDQWPQARFGTPFEALANLSEGERLVICDEFRRLMKSATPHQ